MTEQPATAVAEQLTLGELIAVLEAEDLRTVVPDGFDDPHSYRGYYEELAFEPARDVTVAQMLAAARRALGNTYEGYKGGHFTMGAGTPCWLATWGACGEELTAERLRDMLTAGQTATAPANSIPIHGHMPPAADIETILADPGGACPDCVRIVIEGFRAEVKRLRKELDQVRRAGEEELEYAAQRYAMADAMRGDACIERDRLAEQVKRVREQHSARRIYGECGHRHEKPDADLGVKEVRSVGLVCEDGYDYTVCRACCCDPDGDQSRECAENHDRECWPCPTIRVLDGSEAGQ